MTPWVYPVLAEDHGILEPDIQAALSEFYFRLEAVTRDIRRFSRDRKLDNEVAGTDTQHLARVLHDTCEPARSAFDELRLRLGDYVSLDAKMNAAYQRIFNERNYLGSNIDEVLQKVLDKWIFLSR